MNSKILVLGAKFNVTLPDEDFKKIYTANGAAILAQSYKKKFKEVFHTCVFGEQEFLKNSLVQKSVIKSNPNRILVRDGKTDLENFSFGEIEKKEKYNPFQDMHFQLQFLNINIIQFILAELRYVEKKKINYFFRCLKRFYFQGFSTGFFALLLALKENPSSKIVVSGIGINEGGGHFYTNESHKGFFSSNEKNKNISIKFRNTNRKRVEKFLFDKLKTSFKNRILSSDEEFCSLTNIARYKCDKILNFTRNID